MRNLATSAMARIAADEARHAELAWEVHAFLAPLLSVAERRDLCRAREEAMAALRGADTSDVTAETTRVAGLPSGEIAVRLVDALDAELLHDAA